MILNKIKIREETYKFLKIFIKLAFKTLKELFSHREFTMKNFSMF